MSCTAFIGTGTWGTAMAILAARAKAEHPVMLWGRDAAKVGFLHERRRHPQLDEVTIPESVSITADPADLQQADLLLWAVPTQHSRAMLEQLAPQLPAVPLLSLSKGLEQQTKTRISELFAAVLGAGAYGCLSGPSHAEEVAKALPVALVAAGPTEVTTPVVERLHGASARIYSSTDLLGVELGGALKNVIAIAAGIADGIGLGDNAKAALITRGLAEIRRLGRALGADDATFAGLAGVGDLLATCYSPFGRNRALGLAVAKGRNANDHIAESGMVAEGAYTCRAAVELGAQHGIELPIASQVASMLWDAKPVHLALSELLTRAAKEEDA